MLHSVSVCIPFKWHMLLNTAKVLVHNHSASCHHRYFFFVICILFKWEEKTICKWREWFLSRFSLFQNWPPGIYLVCNFCLIWFFVCLFDLLIPIVLDKVSFDNKIILKMNSLIDLWEYLMRVWHTRTGYLAFKNGLTHLIHTHT